MISTLLAFLYKEWRDHRVVLFGLALSVPLLLLVASFFVPANVMDDPAIVHVSAWATLAVAVLAFASDLVPGETRRGTMRFLARTPGGLVPAFVAKIVLLIGLMLVAPFYGLFWGGVFAGWPGMDYETFFMQLMLPICLAPWLFAISCWLPRGSLALPATALVLALFALPFYLLHLAFPGVVFLEIDLLVAVGLLSFGAFGVAAVSFTRGYRFGGGFASAAWRGLLASLVLLLPAYSYAGYRTYEWSTFDPSNEQFFIRHVWTGENGDVLFLNTRMRLRGGEVTVNHALIVDADTGEWRRVGRGFNSAELVVSMTNLSATNVLNVVDPSSAVKDEFNPRKMKFWQDYYDASTGEKIKSGWSNVTHPAVTALRRRSIERRIQLGLGYYVNDGGVLKVFDPFRNKTYPSTREQLRGGVIVLPCGWLVKNEIINPDTGDRRPANLTGKVAGLTVDGGVFVSVDGRLSLVDLETGESIELAGPRVTDLLRLGRGNLYRAWHEGRQMLLEFDPEAIEFRTICEGLDVMRATETHVLAIEDGKRVIRLDRKTGEKRVLFPR